MVANYWTAWVNFEHNAIVVCLGGTEAPEQSGGESRDYSTIIIAVVVVAVIVIGLVILIITISCYLKHRHVQKSHRKYT